MLRMLIHPSSGTCEYLVRYCVGCNVLNWGVLVLCSGIGCWWCGIRVQAEPLVVQPASVIKLVHLYSNINMMHGPIRIRYMNCICFMNYSTFISRNFFHVTLKMFTVSAAYFGSTVSSIQVNINIFRNTIIHRAPLCTHTIVVRGYINNCFAYTRITQ